MRTSPEFIALRVNRPGFNDESLQSMLIVGGEHVHKQTGVDPWAEGGPPLLRTAAFFFALYLHENSAEEKQALRTNIHLLCDGYRS